MNAARRTEYERERSGHDDDGDGADEPIFTSSTFLSSPYCLHRVLLFCSYVPSPFLWLMPSPPPLHSFQNRVPRLVQTSAQWTRPSSHWPPRPLHSHSHHTASPRPMEHDVMMDSPQLNQAYCQQSPYCNPSPPPTRSYPPTVANWRTSHNL